MDEIENFLVLLFINWYLQFYVVTLQVHPKNAVQWQLGLLEVLEDI